MSVLQQEEDSLLRTIDSTSCFDFEINFLLKKLAQSRIGAAFDAARDAQYRKEKFENLLTQLHLDPKDFAIKG